MTRILLRLTLFLLLLVSGLWIAVQHYAWQPAEREPAAVMCNSPREPLLIPGQALKVMTWNIQYLAGKRYVFWYENGDDDRPTPDDLAFNLDEVTRVIRTEQPDLVLLQEVSDGARNTDGQDQLALLRERLADLYPCSTQAFNWRAAFIPHPRLAGSAGLKLATLSKYRIDSAERLQLPVQHTSFVLRPFLPKPALLVSSLPLSDGSHLAVINTQQYAHNPDASTLRQQTEATAQWLDRLERRGTPWLIGGDFALLPLGQYARLDESQRTRYPADSPLHALWDKYPMIPTHAEAAGIDRPQWLTHWPNDPHLQGPDRTVDYLFYSPALKRLQARVRQEDTLQISDHLPLIGRFLLPVQAESR